MATATQTDPAVKQLERQIAQATAKRDKLCVQLADTVNELRNKQKELKELTEGKADAPPADGE